MENFFCFKTISGTTKGEFNIYQGKDGAIYLLICSNAIKLTDYQVKQLPVNLYSLPDFSQTAYLNYYI